MLSYDDPRRLPHNLLEFILRFLSDQSLSECLGPIKSECVDADIFSIR